ncbi:alpha/beta hydrolase [Actinomadura latina]|uniref:Alpha/beta hydrolase fold domain-containing protein n=1 Tax=Actinomadura latina TaxID=163603 RepID=A0A846YVV9_9ACTN|nr:alpha/beta hydrolase [Actinomadura latina]NKZ02386.1 alpha/beta hydrolase fold domain-containing protein [Actinomadura latina]
MSEVTAVKRPPEPDSSVITTEELIAYREAENRWRASSATRAILGEPDTGAAIERRDVALLVVPAQDAVADHGRRYAERLRAAGTSLRLTEYPGARHAFLTLPGVEPQARVARAEIFEFLRSALEV